MVSISPVWDFGEVTVCKVNTVFVSADFSLDAISTGIDLTDIRCVRFTHKYCHLVVSYNGIVSHIGNQCISR